MPEAGESGGAGIASEAEVKKEERKCPVCGAAWTKTEPTLGAVQRAIQEALCAFEAEIHAMDPKAIFGYTGSVARGKVGTDSMPTDKRKPHHGMEPDIRGECGTKYDVDGFIISGRLCKKVKKIGSKRWASTFRGTRLLENKMRAALKARPELAHMKAGKEGFSIVVYAWNEKDKLTSAQAKFLF